MKNKHDKIIGMITDLKEAIGLIPGKPQALNIDEKLEAIEDEAKKLSIGASFEEFAELSKSKEAYSYIRKIADLFPNERVELLRTRNMLLNKRFFTEKLNDSEKAAIMAHINKIDEELKRY